MFSHKYIDVYYFGKDYNYLEINSGGYFYYNINFLHNLDKKILEFFIKNVSSFSSTIKSSNIINKTPYIIRYYMPVLTEKDICYKWLENKTINPVTLRKIKENGPIFKELQKKCSLNQKKETKLTEKDLCDKWLENKTINPATLRKIKENGPIFKELEKKCLVKSEPKSFKSFKSLEISNTKKISAIKKIHKLFIPYIKRTSVNIIDRVNYFTIMKRYLLSIKETKNCVRLYNIDEKTKKPIYRVGNRIILDKQIGSPSAFGIVFLSHFKSNIKYGTKFDKLNKFAVKITNQTKENKKEIKILEQLTKEVIELKCPHFPISYGSLRCNNSRAKSDNPDDYSIVKDKHNKKKLFPKLVNKNKSLLIQINELASGDFNNYLRFDQNTDKFNTITQILISIMFFHDRIKSYHNDCHTGNFLYHRIKPGGYFYYIINGIEYYLENKGYLWVIWDFGLIQPLTDEYININYDYDYLFDALQNYNHLFTADENKLKTNLFQIINKYKNNNIKLLEKLDNDILNYLVKYIPSFTNKKPLNIINKIPYIIGTKRVIKPSYFIKILNYIKPGNTT